MLYNPKTTTGRPGNLSQFKTAMDVHGFHWALGSFLDEIRSSTNPQALEVPPPEDLPPSMRAFLAGTTESLAHELGLPVPAWVADPAYVLPALYCEEIEEIVIEPQVKERLYAIIEAQTPPEFLRHNIVIRASALKRI